MSYRSLVTGILLFSAAAAGYAAGQGQETPAGKSKEAAAPALKTIEDQASYAIGLDIGRGMVAEKLALNPDLVIRGILDGMKKAKPLMTDEEIKTAMTKFTESRQAKMAEEAKSAGAKNLKDGETFLTANKAKPNVKTTESGLQYEVLKSGTGASPKATDVVKVHYHGTLIDGKVFDSSVERKEPAEFPVNRVIPGWTEALQKMKVGDKWKIVLPSKLAYGERGTPGGPIPPNAVLVFEVELLDIVK